MGKETYLHSKRDLFVWQKRPICIAKETYLYGKRDPFAWQKRPICMAKEAYLHGTGLNPKMVTFCTGFFFARAQDVRHRSAVRGFTGLHDNHY